MVAKPKCRFENASTQIPDSVLRFVSLTVPVMLPPSFTKTVMPEVTLPLVTATGLVS